MGIKQRRAKEREELKHEILEAARALFVKEGYENVSIRRVADKIEYSPGTIYLYFKDKADIFDTLCEETFSKLAGRLTRILEDTDDPLEKLRRAGRTYIQFAVENPNHYLVTFAPKRERLESGDDMERLHSAGTSCFNNLRLLVGQAIDAGKLRTTDVEEVSQILWACVHGLSMLLINCPGFPFLEQSRLIDRLLDVCVAGLKA